MLYHPSNGLVSESAVNEIIGGGEMGQRIRQFDWKTTTLGPLQQWPQSLKSAVNIVLHSSLPVLMLWGPNGIMIYNDAYSVIAGERHPRLLGSKVLEGWAEVADFNRNVLGKVLVGETLSYLFCPYLGKLGALARERFRGVYKIELAELYYVHQEDAGIRRIPERLRSLGNGTETEAIVLF